jgi:uncharacterized membrane protein YkoI
VARSGSAEGEVHVSRTVKRALVIGAAAALVAGGGSAIAGAANGAGDDDDDGAAEISEASEEITDRAVIERASAVALKETGGGRVSEVEVADDGVAGYEVEVTREDGTEAEINVDRDFGIVSVEDDD